MFSFLRKETLSLQLYGKLPLAKDYLRIGSGDGAGRHLREWLDQSFSGAAGTAAPALPFAMRFMLDAGASPLMGCLWPSSDSGGLRPFPFSVFLERKRKPLVADVESGLEHAEGVWRRIDSTHNSHRNAPDGQSYLGAMRAQTLDLETIDSEHSSSMDFSPWLEALFGSDGKDGLERVFAGLQMLVPSSPRGPLRLPLVSNMSPIPQVVAWWNVAVQIGLFPSNQVPSVFFPHQMVDEEEPAFVLFFPRMIQTGDVRWLSSARSGSACGPGDFAAGEEARLSTGQASSEGAAPLTDSLRGALLSFSA
ncbi:MAG: hypothetical protein ACI841_005424, partial [Planctomycetota bacterium]